LRLKQLLLGLVFNIKPALRILNSLVEAYVGGSRGGVQRLCYEFAKCYGEKSGARSLDQLSASTVGNPEDVFTANGNTYTTSVLQYYILYAYCCQYMKFDSIRTIMELGCGSGKQIEVMRTLHPHLCFYLFDIPPQLYVCEQYLSAVFPGSVVSYRETREMAELTEPREGKIYLFGTWKLPDLERAHWDLFWNSASFQEMEPDLVLNYLSFVNRLTREYVFLQENMRGMKQAHRKGEFGVLQATTLEHYNQGLPAFETVDMSDSVDLWQMRGLHAAPPYTRSFWRRRL
jgi:putative sugar O-methyltransferase